MREPTPTEAIDLVGRFEAGQETPERMRTDVRLLSSLLGRVLDETGSEGLLDDVERLRIATIQAYTDETPEAFDRAAEVAASFSSDRAEEVARAFTCYFHLINLAEEHQRVRSLREREGSPDREVATDSLGAAYAHLLEEVGEEAAKARLDSLRFHPVFTAHPTEARRRAVSESIRRLAHLLEQHENYPNGGAEKRRAERRIVEEIDTLWRTAPLRPEKPSPIDEVRTVTSIFESTLYTVVPYVYRRSDDAIKRGGGGKSAPLVPSFVRVGTWIGGDRDGNPYVTAKVTRTAAGVASEQVLHALEQSADRIGRALTLDADTTPPSEELTALWNRLKAADQDAAAEIAQRSPNEPYRRVMLLIAHKIAATRTRNLDLSYRNPAQLLEDLRIVQNSLAQMGATRQAYGKIQQLIWQVETYGFHLAELEVRQHSAVHAKVLARLDAGEEPNEQDEEVLDVFRTIAFLQDRYGPESAGRYIVSFTQSPEDLLAVYRLARHAASSPEQLPTLDVVPLFETFADLQAAPQILEAVIHHPDFQQRLNETGRRMEVMLGYSDSSKDVGPVAATLALYQAQSEIAEWAQKHNIELTLFHGRGGALGRGGGPANSAILAQPPHSVDGRFKLTEQGEIIFARYGDPDIAARHIEQVGAAILLSSAPSFEQRNREAAAEFADIAAVMDAASRERFFSLVKAPNFAPWFARVTPVDEIGLLALGSRPARRGLSVESLEDLRAIPWVFAWTQARINLAGWFGLGTALAAVGDLERLQTAYSKWPLFRTMIDNVAMSLAKADSRIAQRYLDLGDREDLSQLVMDEMSLTVDWINRITRSKRLLDNKPVLQRAVKMRSPYVDALSLLQLRALSDLRKNDTADVDPEKLESQRRLLLLSVNGVAAGLQNTG